MLERLQIPTALEPLRLNPVTLLLINKVPKTIIIIIIILVVRITGFLAGKFLSKSLDCPS